MVECEWNNVLLIYKLLSISIDNFIEREIFKSDSF